MTDTAEALQNASAQVAGPYAGEAWWAVGAMPLVLIALGVMCVGLVLSAGRSVWRRATGDGE